MASSVIEVDDGTFEQDVLKSDAALVVVEFTDFYKVNTRGAANASAKMDAVIDSLASDDAYTDVRFVRVPIELDKTKDPIEVTRNSVSAERYAINHGPTTVFIKNGQEVGSQVVGFYDEQYITRRIEDALEG